MIYTLLPIAFTVLALVVLGVSLVYVGRTWAIPIARTALETYWSERWETVDERLRALEEDVGSLPRVWEEFSRDSKKAQERARWHVRRVKKELERHGLADGEIDSLDSELRRVDGEGSNGQGLLPLHDVLEESPQGQPQTPIDLALSHKWRMYG